MVHALKEAWRVLRRGGLLIDLRPLSVDVPLLILTRNGWESAGMPDQSPDRVHERAADQAIRRGLQEGLFVKAKQKYFVVNYYWNELKELKAFAEGPWKGSLIISKDIWQQAKQLLRNGSGARRVRIFFRKKITVYQKK